MPLQIRDKRDTKAFLKEAQKTSRRRNDLSWKSFDEFKKDLGQVYFSEDQNYTDMWGGKKLILLACSCIDGVKGRMCDHVLALYYEKKIMKPFSEQPKVGRYRRNSNAHWITMIPSKQPNSKIKISTPATLVQVPASFKW